MSEGSLDREEILRAIQLAAEETSKSYLSYQSFREITSIPMSQVLKHFDKWTDACRAAGIRPGEASPKNLKPQRSRGRAHAVGEVKRVAAKLGVKTLSKRQFDEQETVIKSCTVANLCGGWENALKDAGLERHPQSYDIIPMSALATHFFNVYVEVGRIPTLQEVSRRSKHGKNAFYRKFGGFIAFKKAAIEYLLREGNVDSESSQALEEHLKELTPDSGEDDYSCQPHSRGRTLGFRAFAYAPTYESEVVSMFSSIADELGFEIVAQRPAFPDCEARRLADSKRRRYKKCLIEFELRSSDYKKHKHPLKGCDLIVCWLHDWEECPIEVLELRSRINKLPGWK